MCKGLEALKRSFDSWEYLKDYKTIEKELKALEIIKKFPYELTNVIAQPTYEMYCLWFANFKNVKPKLSENQYNVIREVMLCH